VAGSGKMMCTKITYENHSISFIQFNKQLIYRFSFHDFLTEGGFGEQAVL
jgi:hypothetical protein